MNTSTISLTKLNLGLAVLAVVFAIILLFIPSHRSGQAAPLSSAPLSSLPVPPLPRSAAPAPAPDLTAAQASDQVAQAFAPETLQDDPLLVMISQALKNK